ncbi:hypothetical protein [Streptomyces wuyuanensis]
MDAGHSHGAELYGWGQLPGAFASCCREVFGLLINNLGIRQRA